jgi:thioredoxin 1
MSPGGLLFIRLCCTHRCEGWQPTQAAWVHCPRVLQGLSFHRAGAVRAVPAEAEVADLTVAEPVALHELTPEDFWDYVNGNKDALTVVDFYTDWCGPCKAIYPKLLELSAAEPSVNFVKFNCKSIFAKDLGIKALPTFQLYRGGEKVAEMTGAPCRAGGLSNHV